MGSGHSINILNIKKRGTLYVGFFLGMLWDPDLVAKLIPWVNGNVGCEKKMTCGRTQKRWLWLVSLITPRQRLPGRVDRETNLPERNFSKEDCDNP